MQKKLVSFFFLILFTLYVFLLTIISIVVKLFENFFFYNVNEEDKKANVAVKIIEAKLLESYFKVYSTEFLKAKFYRYYPINYILFTSKLISPPPDYI